MIGRMLPQSVFVSGANRGIGLEFVKQFVGSSDAPNVVFAGCRAPEKAGDLNKIAQAGGATKVVVLPLDVCNEQQIEAAVKIVETEVGGDGLNLLINNAGLYNRDAQSLDNLSTAGLIEHFKVNCIAPLMIAKAFLPLLKTASAKKSNLPVCTQRSAIINISTKMGSIADNSSGGQYAYRTSKTALNMASKSLAEDLKADGILCVPVHPGWVRTDMGGPNGLIDAPDSVSGMIQLFRRLTAEQTGNFYNYKGELLPW